MAKFSKYPQAPFKEEQNFLARDPSTSEIVRVSGKDILDAFGADDIIVALDDRWISKYTTDQLSTATSLRAGNLVRTPGYYASGDGGGNDFIVEERDGSAEDGGSIIFIDGTLLQLRALFKKGWVDIRKFGHKGDGTAGDMEKLQAAVAYLKSQNNQRRGVLYLGTASILIEETLVFDFSNFAIFGDGHSSCKVFRTDGTFGSTIKISAADPSVTRLSEIVINGVRIDCDVSMMSGAHLEIHNVIHCDITNTHLWNCFIGIDGYGLQNTFIDHSVIKTGAHYSTEMIGSRFVRISDNPAPSLKTTEVFISNFNWTFTINPKTIEYGLEIKACDGVWFSNGHILGPAKADLLVNMDDSPLLAGLLFDNVWFDGFTPTNLQFANVPVGAAKDFKFIGCEFSGAEENTILSSAGAVFAGANFTGCIFKNSDCDGATLRSGEVWQFNGCEWSDINRDLISGGSAVEVPGVSTVRKIIVNGGSVGDDSTIDYGFNIADADTEFNISGVSFSGIAIEEILLSPSAELNGSVLGCTTDRAGFDEVASATSISVSPVAEIVSLTGATATVESIFPRWGGRKLALRGDTAAHTIAHGAGNIINQSGASNTLSANRALNYQYNSKGNAFYQIG